MNNNSLVVDEEIPPHCVKCFECLEKHYINVNNYYYSIYYSHCYLFMHLLNISALKNNSIAHKVVFIKKILDRFGQTYNKLPLEFL